MNIKYTFIVALVIATIILVGCVSSEPVAPTPHSGEALVATKCSTCHSIVQVDNAKYSREIWETTVNRMVMAGMQITDEQKAQVIDYLAIRDSE